MKYGHIIALCSGFVTTLAIGQQSFWANPVGGSLLDGSNWLGGVAPTSSNHLVFDVPSEYGVTLPSSFGVQSIDVRRGDVDIDLQTNQLALLSPAANQFHLRIGADDGSTARLRIGNGSLFFPLFALQGDLLVGHEPNTRGELTLVGAGASFYPRWQEATARIGQGASGIVRLREGASLSVYVGGETVDVGVHGVIDADGPSVVSGMWLANNGSVYLRNGASVYTSKSITGTGLLDISGSGSSVQCSTAQMGTLNASNGAQLHGSFSLGIGSILGSGTTSSGVGLYGQKLTIGEGAVVNAYVVGGNDVNINGVGTHVDANWLEGNVTIDQRATVNVAETSLTGANVTVQNANLTDLGLISTRSVVEIQEGGSLASPLLQVQGQAFTDGIETIVLPAVLRVRAGGSINVPQVVLKEYGHLDGNGVVVGNITNGGVIQPGVSDVLLSVSGNLSMTDSGKLALPLSANGELLHVSGQVDLRGNLIVLLGNTPSVNVGDSFTLLSATNISGAFAEVETPVFYGGLTLQITQSSTEITATVVPTSATIPVILFGLGCSTRRRRLSSAVR